CYRSFPVPFRNQYRLPRRACHASRTVAAQDYRLWGDPSPRHRQWEAFARDDSHRPPELSLRQRSNPRQAILTMFALGLSVSVDSAHGRSAAALIVATIGSTAAWLPFAVKSRTSNRRGFR